MLATRDDILRCYSVILNREPEHESVVDRFLERSLSIWDLIEEFLGSTEKKNMDRLGFAFSFEKCLLPPYLAKSIDMASGLRCYHHNVDFVCNALQRDHTFALMHEELEIYAFEAGGYVYRVTVQFSREMASEGELSLHFKEGRSTLYILSFTFVPGDIFDSKEARVVLLSRVQGLKGRRDEVRRATKATGDIAPQSYLLSVLQGIAMASGADELYGVHSSNQVCYEEAYKDFFARSYDDFFASSGLAGPAAGFYKTALPMQHKDISKIVSWHRLRTKFKRGLRHEIVERVGAKWRSFMKAAGRTSGSEPSRPDPSRQDALYRSAV